MATAVRPPAIGLLTIPRAVLSIAAGFCFSVERAVVGDDRVRTARNNAWEAMCVDQARARARDDTRRAVAELAALNAQLTVGSSPRSSASQAVLVSTRP